MDNTRPVESLPQSLPDPNETAKLIPFEFDLTNFGDENRDSRASERPSNPCPACLSPIQADEQTLSCVHDHLAVHKACAETVELCPFPDCGEALFEEFPLASAQTEETAPKAAYRCPGCFDDVQSVDRVAACPDRHFFVHQDCLELLSECPALGCNQPLQELENFELPQESFIRVSSEDLRQRLLQERLERRQQRREHLARLRAPLVQQRQARRERQMLAYAERVERSRRLRETVLEYKRSIAVGLVFLTLFLVTVINPSFLPSPARIECAKVFGNKEVLLELVRSEQGRNKADAIRALTEFELDRDEVATVCAAYKDSSTLVTEALQDFIEKKKPIAITEILNRMKRKVEAQDRAIALLKRHKLEASRAALEALRTPTIFFNRHQLNDLLVELKPDSISVLIEQLKSSDDLHNERAVVILKRLYLEAEPDLLRALQTGDPQVQVYALRCLQVNPRTLPAILSAVKSDDKEVKTRALVLLLLSKKFDLLKGQ